MTVSCVLMLKYTFNTDTKTQTHTGSVLPSYMKKIYPTDAVNCECVFWTTDICLYCQRARPGYGLCALGASGSLGHRRHAVCICMSVQCMEGPKGSNCDPKRAQGFSSISMQQCLPKHVSLCN